MSDQLSFIVEVLVGAPVPTVCPCEAFGRVTTIYASGHVRDRLHVARCYSGERRCLIVDFNGAAIKGQTISSVKWSVQDGSSARLEHAVIDGRKAKVSLTAGSGCTLLSCHATFGDGCQVLVQAIRIETETLWNHDQGFSGPTELVVTA